MEQSIPARFEQVVLEYPDRLAVKDEQRGYTYRELDEYSNRLAHSILGHAIPPQTPVAVMVEQGFLHIAAVLGVLKANGVVVALDPVNPAARVRHMLADSGARLIVVDRNSRSLAAGLAEDHHLGSIAVDEMAASLPWDNPKIPIAPHEIGCLLYTSGSSGVPKASVVPHRYLMRHVLKSTNGMHVSYLDRLSLLSSPGASAAIGTWLVALMNGASVFPFSVQARGLQALGEWLRREEITVYQSVPTLFRHLAQNLPESTPFPSLRMIRLSGEPVLRREVDLFKSRIAGDVLLCNSLGSTEGGVITEYYIRRDTPFDGAVLPVGYEADGMQVIVVDDAGHETTPGQIGEITVRIRSQGYWRRPDLTHATFLEDSGGGDRRIYRTGDIGYMLPDRCLVHLGRRDFQVKVRGYRVELAEVETALMDVPGIREAVVAAKKDALGDTRLVAYVVPEEGTAVSDSVLRGLLKQRLPDFMIPAGFVTLDALPLGPSGKVDRLALPDPAGEESGGENADREMGGDTAAEVAQLWKKLLGRGQVGLHDNFFDLGGDSLLATTMALEIEKQFRVRLPVDVLFDLPTPARLAAAISAGTRADLGECLVPIQPAGSRPPLYCVHGVDGGVGQYRLLAHHLGADQPVYALRPRSLTGNHPLSYSVEEMASHYIEDIVAFQPEGPYNLAGHSAGGVFAFETARQLRNRGCQVGLVALFDTVCLGHTRRVPLPEKARRHLALLFSLPPSRRLGHLRDRVKVLRDRLLRLLPRVLHGAVNKGLPLGGAIGTLDSAIVIALSGYRSRPYPGRLVVFAATDDGPLSLHSQGQLQGWQAVASEGAEFRQVPGNHGNLMQEPQVAVLARDLAGCLRRVQTRATPTGSVDVERAG